MSEVSDQKSNVPELRFPEFDGIWKNTTLGNIASFKKGKSISKSDIKEGAETPCVRYGQLYTDYDTLIDKPISYTNLPVKELILSNGGEVIIPASGETAQDIATAAVILRQGIALGGDLNIIETPLDGFFLASYMSGAKRHTLAKLAQGVSVVHIYPNHLRLLKLNFPTLQEQQKIASFLTAVDEKIVLHEKKKALLEDYKKGCMQKLFSRTLRFKDDNGNDFPDWEEKRLGEIATRITSKNTDVEHTRVLSNSAIKGVVDQREYFDHDIANQDNLSGYYIVDQGDFVYNPRISASAPVGPIKRNNIGLGVMSPLYDVFQFDNKNTNLWVHYFGSSTWHKYMKTVANYGARHDRMAISTSDFMNMPILFPHPTEQKKIANFLSAIDTKITHTGEQLAQSKAFKKGLLQKMFV